MVNIRTRVATMNIVFSSTRYTALTERKMLQYITLSLYIERIENSSFYIIRRPYLSLNTLRESETTLKLVLIEKGVKNPHFCSLHEFKRAVHTLFLLIIVLSN